MKVLNLLLCVMMMASLALTSCQSDKASKVEEKAEATLGSATPAASPAATTEVAAKPAEAVPAGPTTTIKFDESSYDFGVITDGDKVRHTFKFTNTGKEPLIISNCKGSCGCTVPQCPKDPIAPGANGEITIEYNSRGKSKGGPAEGKPDQKFVNVTANTDPGSTRLTIKAMVKPDPNAPAETPKNADSK
jgi:hypothetical protein